MQHLHACVYLGYDEDRDFDIHEDNTVFVHALSRLTKMCSMHLHMVFHEKCAHCVQLDQGYHPLPHAHYDAYKKLVATAAVLQHPTSLALQCERAGIDHDPEEGLTQRLFPADCQLQPLLHTLQQLPSLQPLSFNVLIVDKTCVGVLDVLGSSTRTKQLTSLTLHRVRTSTTEGKCLLDKGSSLPALQHVQVQQFTHHDGHADAFAQRFREASPVYH